MNDTLIRGTMLFDNAFVHSSVTLRLETLRKNRLSYDPLARGVEDYDLWSRLLEYGKGVNLYQPFVYRRIHSAQVSLLHGNEGAVNAARIAQKNLLKLGFNLSVEQTNILRTWQHHIPIVENVQQEVLTDTILDIIEAFEHQPGLDPQQVRLVRGRWLLRLALANTVGLVYHWHKVRLIRRLRPIDLISMVQFMYHRRIYKTHKLRFPSKGKFS
jgi:hypothetical protein